MIYRENNQKLLQDTITYQVVTLHISDIDMNTQDGG